jgi:hypothetical protein
MNINDGITTVILRQGCYEIIVCFTHLGNGVNDDFIFAVVDFVNDVCASLEVSLLEFEIFKCGSDIVCASYSR